MSTSRVSYVISVLSPDRLGIIADVSDAVYAMGGNFEAASQTIMQGWFTMVLSATFPADVNCEQVVAGLRAAGDFDVIVHETRVAEHTDRSEGEPFIMTAVGDDKPGIVRRLSRCCADEHVNIEDVWNEVRERRFITIFHLTVPRGVDPNALRALLESVASELGVVVTLQHQDIFTATNSLQVHTNRRGR